jgi:hypothetical protein
MLWPQELEGRFIKWNNNAGAVRAHPTSPARRKPTGGPAASGLLGIIGEDEDEVDEGSGSEESSEGVEEARVEDVAQCFSHFTYEATDGEKLVCDLQVIGFASERLARACDGLAQVCVTVRGVGERGVTGLGELSQE